MDSFHTSCGSRTWEKNTRERPGQNWAQKTPKGHPKKKKKEKKGKKVYIQRHMLFGKIVLVHAKDKSFTLWCDFALVAWKFYS